jgi:hypothetical protein
MVLEMHDRRAPLIESFSCHLSKSFESQESGQTNKTIQKSGQLLDISCKLAGQRTIDVKWMPGFPVRGKRVPPYSECLALLLNPASGAETCSDFVHGCFFDFFRLISLCCVLMTFCAWYWRCMTERATLIESFSCHLSKRKS